MTIYNSAIIFIFLIVLIKKKKKNPDCRAGGHVQLLHWVGVVAI